MNKLPQSIAALHEPSEYLQEILATPPRWIIRWGQIGVCLLVAALLALGWLIRYPDRIPAQVIITTPNPPIEVIAQAEGALTHLQVKDHEVVKAGALLAVIQSAARYEDVKQLQKQLLALTDHFSWATEDTLFASTYQLGSLQQAYTLVQQARKAYALHLQLTPHYRQQQAVGRELHRYEAMLAQKQHQQHLLERQVQLAEKDYRRNEQLHASGVIADKALEDQEQAWIEAQAAVGAHLSEISQKQVEMAHLQREWQQFNTQHTQAATELQLALRTATEDLRAQIQTWEKQHVLRAPIAGQVSFFDFWSEQQFIRQGQAVMSIVPQEVQQAVGRLRVPVQNFGKVAVGQPVQVYLDNYPYEEYGALSGRVDNISYLPRQGYYSVLVSFPQGLLTHYGKQIPFSQQLQGKAEITTEELRLIERIFYRIRTSWKPS